MKEAKRFQKKMLDDAQNLEKNVEFNHEMKINDVISSSTHLLIWLRFVSIAHVEI